MKEFKNEHVAEIGKSLDFAYIGLKLSSADDIIANINDSEEIENIAYEMNFYQDLIYRFSVFYYNMSQGKPYSPMFLYDLKCLMIILKKTHDYEYHSNEISNDIKEKMQLLMKEVQQLIEIK